ncbi:MAG: hypothetical protein ABIA63_09840 [bacterium]
MKLRILIIAGFLLSGKMIAQENNIEDKGLYKMDKPGTITFKTGTEIVAKTEKPQVEIFIEKEKPKLLKVMEEPSLVNLIEKPLKINTFYINTNPIK